MSIYRQIRIEVISDTGEVEGDGSWYPDTIVNRSDLERDIVKYAGFGLRRQIAERDIQVDDEPPSVKSLYASDPAGLRSRQAIKPTQRQSEITPVRWSRSIKAAVSAATCYAWGISTLIVIAAIATLSTASVTPWEIVIASAACGLVVHISAVIACIVNGGSDVNN